MTIDGILQNEIKAAIFTLNNWTASEVSAVDGKDTNGSWIFSVV